MQSTLLQTKPAFSWTLGTIFVNNDYLLTAFSKFDDKNRAFLTMPDYLAFLINFWDKV
ncbi:DUF6430 domain-containing protein, partial [Salmonella enterica subsp. enterica serovar Anatum]|nr:DUF6430 domain-containing protein [Salmonella enterica subsp. enterica serovar Anatum]